MDRVFCWLFPLMFVSLPLSAQTTASGSVRGVAKDQQGAVLPGVTVSATSPTVPRVYTATTDREGRYRLGDMQPGDYAVSAELAGFSRFLRSPVSVRSGLNLDVDVTLSVGGLDEVIEVRVDTPLLETQTGGHTVNISGELLRSLPLSERREWFGALMVAPGVTSSEWVNNERLLSVHGADATSNIVQIDGVDVTPAQLGGIRYISLNTDAIDDIQIKTAGVDASAPLGLGGIINIATASGTNALQGVGSFSYQPRKWNGSNTPGGTSSTVAQTQVDLSGGGPLFRDRLWAVAAYRYADLSTGVSRTPAQLEALRVLAPSVPLLDSESEAHLWLAKLTAQPWTNHQLSGLYQRDITPLAPVEASTAHPTREATGGLSASFRISSVWSDRLTTRFAASHNDKRRDNLFPGIGGPLQRVFSASLASAGRLVGNGRIVDLGAPRTAWTTRPNSKTTISLDASYFASHATGAHDLQAGIYTVPRARIDNRNVYINDGFTFEEAVLRTPGVLSSGIVPFHRQFVEGRELVLVRQQGQNYAFYLQDAWRPSSRLTVNAGLRVDRVIWEDQLFGVTSQRSTELGPRFGVNYSLSGDGRNVARAHWVRVHDQPSQMATSVGSSTLGQRDVYDLNLDGTFETTFITPATFAITPGRRIGADLHQPFIREWGAGYSRQFGGNLAAGLDFVDRRYLDRPTLVETNGVYSGSRFVGYANEAFNEIYEATNNEWNSPVYRSLELSVTKRTARVQGVASYVRQWRHIDGTWQPNDPALFIQPEAFANNRGIGSTVGTTAGPTDADSLSGTQMTQRSTASGQWQDHAVRLGVTYVGPWELLLATNYTFQSGIWSGPVISRVAAPDPAFGPSTVTLSNGRVVSNPLATVLRFAYPTRGEGQLTTPDLHTWNVRLGKRLNWRQTEFDLAVDIFNVTNSGTDFSFLTGANQTYNPLFGLTTFRQLPRSAQAMARISF